MGASLSMHTLSLFTAVSQSLSHFYSSLFFILFYDHSAPFSMALFTLLFGSTLFSLLSTSPVTYALPNVTLVQCQFIYQQLVHCSSCWDFYLIVRCIDNLLGTYTH